MEKTRILLFCYSGILLLTINNFLKIGQNFPDLVRLTWQTEKEQAKLFPLIHNNTGWTAVQKECILSGSHRKIFATYPHSSLSLSYNSLVYESIVQER